MLPDIGSHAKDLIMRVPGNLLYRSHIVFFSFWLITGPLVHASSFSSRQILSLSKLLLPLLLLSFCSTSITIFSSFLDFYLILNPALLALLLLNLSLL